MNEWTNEWNDGANERKCDVDAKFIDDDSTRSNNEFSVLFPDDKG